MQYNLFILLFQFIDHIYNSQIWRVARTDFGRDNRWKNHRSRPRLQFMSKIIGDQELKKASHKEAWKLLQSNH